MTRCALAAIAASVWLFAGCNVPANLEPVSIWERPGEWDCTAYLDVDALGWRARQGDAGAQHMLARAHRAGRDVPQDYEMAALWFRRAAEGGHVGAQAMLGRMHYWGEGLPRDVVAAAEWYRRAAARGHAMAQLWLGDLYSAGQGVSRDRNAAAEWYRRAAKQGHAEAQWWLGNVYAWGRGVPQDDIEALTWYALAAPRLSLARRSYEDAVTRLSSTAVAEAQQRAQAFRPVVEIEPGCVP